MGQSQTCGAILTRRAPPLPGAYGRSVQRLRGSRCGLGLVGLLLAAGSTTQPLPAQSDSSRQDVQLYRRLTVRPREMATATRTERAGVHELAPTAVQLTEAGALGPAKVYVPQKCVGTRRCPLLLFMWDDWTTFTLALRPMSDKYGIILLYPAALYDVYTSGPEDSVDSVAADEERQHLDATLKQVLQQFAIDPDKIAVMGTCKTARMATNIGGSNFSVFNRIIALSGYPVSSDIKDLEPPTPAVEFFFEDGIDEFQGAFQVAQEMQDNGYRVTRTFGLRGHGHNVDSYNRVGRWLQETWALPTAAARPAAPSVIADPLPTLTLDVLTQMTAFWTRFAKEPDSILLTGRQAHLREVVVPVGRERPGVEMMDMAALAAAYPSVAADLKAAGLTAQEHDAYRYALVSARVTDYFDATATVEPTSVMAKNIAFMKAHIDELGLLDNARYNGTNALLVYSPGNVWYLP